jgi:aryl-phospho-beta-D-glucosidase BglC (GH1 family)
VLPLRGVNLCGLEFGETELPGTCGVHYTSNSEASYRYFAAKGLGLIRLPLLWERLQPVAGSALEAGYLGLLRQNLEWARVYGMQVIPVIQNFGRYYGQVAEAGALADLWMRLSVELRDDPAAYAYDLMNEPHDLGDVDWKAMSQAVLMSIRGAGDDKLIMVPGDNWSDAESWPRTHGPDGWIVDPANHFRYEAHLYLDRDHSGRYRGSYEAEGGSPDTGPKRLAPFLSWCRHNGVEGYLGEFGVPGDDPRWLVAMRNLLTELDAAGFDSTYWAAGEWWGDYPLSVQPTEDFAVDRPQLSELLRR